MALCLTTVTEGLQKYICSVYLIAYICIFQARLGNEHLALCTNKCRRSRFSL